MPIGGLSSLLGHLLYVELALDLALVQKVVRDLDGVVGMIYSVVMLVDLTEKGADLHVRFAFVLQHLQS